MATLKLENGTIHTDLQTISRKLSSLNIQLNHRAIGDNPQLHHLLTQEQLSEDEKEQVLTALDRYFEQLQHTANYQSRDLIVLHPKVANLDALLAKFERVHTHAEDEVRYISTSRSDCCCPALLHARLDGRNGWESLGSAT